MKKYYLDTNVILRFLLKDNENYFKKALNLFEKAKNKEIEIIIIPEVFFEIDYVLRGFYSLPKNKVVDILLNLAKTPYLKIENREIIIHALEKYKDLNIDLFDLYLYYLAKSKKSEVFSFDKDFERLKKDEK